MLGFGLLTVLVIIPFRPADESAHAAYGLSVSEGRLPTLREQVVREFPGQRRVPQHVANHPPLYYLLVAPALGSGVDGGHALVGLRIARVQTLLLGVGSVLAAAAVALALRRDRPEVAVATAALVATVPAVIAVSSVVHNDALAMLFSTLALFGLARVVLRGLRPAPVVLTSVCVVGALATRGTAAGLAGLVVCGFLVGGVLHARSRWRGLLAGAACGIGMLAAAAAVTGWFYLRNIRLYGDWTGAAYLQRTYRRAPLTTEVGYLTDPKWYVRFAETIAGGPGEMPTWMKLLLGLLYVGVVLGALAGLRRLRRRRLPGPVLAVAGLFLLHVALLWVAMANHVSTGGGPNSRYMFPAISVLALAVASGLAALPWGPPGSWLVAGLWFQAMTVVSWLLGTGRRQHPTGFLDLLPTAVSDAGMPFAAGVVGLLLALVLAGLVLASLAILDLARGRHELPRDVAPQPPDVPLDAASDAPGGPVRKPPADAGSLSAVSRTLESMALLGASGAGGWDQVRARA